MRSFEPVSPSHPGDEDMDLSGDGGSEGGASGDFHSEHSGDSVPGLSGHDDSDGDGHPHDDDDSSEDDGVFSGGTLGHNPSVAPHLPIGCYFCGS